MLDLILIKFKIQIFELFITVLESISLALTGGGDEGFEFVEEGLSNKLIRGSKSSSATSISCKIFNQCQLTLKL